ncbi:uncharacterized protein [Eurosta solidaginis]|uniref:uncharacterized protein isoform X1 n=1 Tax=Eurosta solidaginis TaxID=178769 RepID=UPI0035309F58
MTNTVITTQSSPLSIVIFLTSSCLVAGQGRKSGSCRTDIQYLQSVDRGAFEGSWFMQFGMTLDEPNTFFRCRRMDFKFLFGDQSVPTYKAREFKISHEYLQEPGTANTGTAITGTLKFPRDWDGQFRIRYFRKDSTTFRTEPINWNSLRYKVLSLDCDKLIIYACQNFQSGSQHAELVWVYTRYSHPSDDIVDAYRDALRDKGIDVEELYWINHSDCRNYIIPGAPAF